MNPDSKAEPRVQPLRERQRSETARAIAEAAERVFAARGLREAKMEEIAARAGVSVGTVYNHFEDREALLRDLQERRKQELLHKLDAALEEARREPFLAQLKIFARTVFTHFEGHREFLAIHFYSEGQHIEEPTATMKEMRARVEAMVRRGVEQRMLRPQGKELWAFLLLGTVRTVLLNELRNPGQLSLDARVEATLEFFLRGAGA